MELGKRSVRRSGFTLVELLVVIAIIGVLVGLLLPAVQAARESGRRTQCVNNLKQLGLAAQTYHDVKKTLPPAGLGFSGTSSEDELVNEYATWAVLLMPFMEQENLYNKFSLIHPLRGAPNPPQALLVSLEFHLCPSRRQPPAVAGGGAVLDYAAVGGTGPAAGTLEGDGSIIMCNWMPEFNEDGEIVNATWTSPVSFASITDGLSNTAIFGERFVFQGKLGQTDWDGPGYLSRNEYESEDDFAKLGWSTRRMGVGAGLVRDKLYQGEDGMVRFGSYHPSTSQFAMADGSVRNVDNMTSETILRGLAGRADGQVVTGY